MFIGPKLRGKSRIKGQRLDLLKRPDVTIAPEKTWLEERTRNFDVIKGLVDQSFEDGCVGIGSAESSKRFRIGERLSEGAYGSVFAARMVLDGNITVLVAVKIMLNQGYDPRQLYPKEESAVADTLSERVRDDDASNFLLFYGYGWCEKGYMPPEMQGYDRALQVQRWIDTAAEHLDPRIIESLRSGNYDEVDEGLRALFEWTPLIELTQADLDALDDEFLDELGEYVMRREEEKKEEEEEEIDLDATSEGTSESTRGFSVDMADASESVPMSLYIMEIAYKMDTLLKYEDPQIVHVVIGQIFKAARDFYRITSYVHTDLHLGNVMVLKRAGVSEYALVLIDFGRVASIDQYGGTVFKGIAAMILAFFEALENHAYHTGLGILFGVVKSFLVHVKRAQVSGDVLHRLPNIWAGLRPETDAIGAREPNDVFVLL